MNGTSEIQVPLKTVLVLMLITAIVVRRPVKPWIIVIKV
jgi:hypothetical protein